MISRFVFSFVGLCLLTPVVSAQDFPGWGTLHDPVGDCPLDPVAKGMQLTVPGGVHQLNPRMGKVNAPRIWNEVEGNFLYEVRILDFPRPKADSGANGNRSYVAAGIVLWQDEQNFLRWTRSASAERNAVYLSCEQYEAGQLAGGGGFPLKDEPVWLRIERREGQLRMLVSHNGDDWKKVIQRRTTYDSKLKVGLVAINVTENEVRFQFQDPFLLSQAPPKDH